MEVEKFGLFPLQMAKIGGRETWRWEWETYNPSWERDVLCIENPKSNRLAVLEEVGPSWGLFSFSALFLFVEKAIV